MSIPIAMGCRNYQLHSAGVTNIVKLVPMLVQITKSHPIHIRNDGLQEKEKGVPSPPLPACTALPGLP